MDALISAFVEDIKQRAALYNEDSEGNLFNDNSVNETDGEEREYKIYFKRRTNCGDECRNLTEQNTYVVILCLILVLNFKCSHFYKVYSS